jgi:hypothetical protein
MTDATTTYRNPIAIPTGTACPIRAVAAIDA